MPGQRSDSRTRPIGVFDSGVGGLTVLHELLVRLPHEDFVYLGDTARFPYGERAPAELERFCAEIAEELIARSVKLLVVACNTATAAALPALRRRMMETTLGVDVLAVVRPEAVQAVASTTSGRIGLLATPATVASGAYAEALAAVDPHVTLVAVACPDLAPIIQRGSTFDDDGRADGARVRRAAARRRGRHGHPRVHALPARASAAAAHARAGRGDRHVGRRARAPGGACPRSRALGSPQTGEGDYRFLCTGDADAFRAAGTRFLQLPLGTVERDRPADGGGRVSRSYDRGPDELRPTTIEPGFVRTATGSALISMGETRVICTASHQDGVPRWLSGSGRGWVTAEYAMLPASTGERKQRDVTRGRPDGRTVEIQRLIGRAIRGVVDFEALGENTIYLDCDVLQADGGTRCASITGAYVALALAVARLREAGKVGGVPLTGSVAAVSSGIVGGTPLLDLDYREDSSAEVDANVVMTGEGGLVEVQATAERTPLSRAHLDDLLGLAAKGIDDLRAAQERAVIA